MFAPIIFNTPSHSNIEGMSQPEPMEIQETTPSMENSWVPDPEMRMEKKGRQPLITPDLLRNGPITYAVTDFITQGRNRDSVSETEISASSSL